MKEKVLKSRVTVYLHTVIISNYVIINNEMLWIISRMNIIASSANLKIILNNAWLS